MRRRHLHTVLLVVVIGLGSAVALPLGGAAAQDEASIPPSGVLDTTFGCDTPPCPGWASYDLGLYTAVTVLDDGKILAAGGTDGSFLVDRWSPDGVLDTDFGCDSPPCTGRANIVADGAFTAIAARSDGKIVAGGDLTVGSDTSFVVYRLEADGTVDTTFGCDTPPCAGFVAEPDGEGRDLVLQPDGKIVMVGYEDPNGPFVVARYTADGVLDESFGCDTPPCAGFTTGPGGVAQGVALAPDGKIVVAGVSDDPTGRFRVARYTTDGVLDTTFGCVTAPCPGYVSDPAGPSLGGSDRIFAGIAIAPDGGIVVSSNDGSAPFTPNFRTARYTTDGVLDTTFGCDAPPCDGYVSGPAGLVNGNGTMLQSDGKVVLAGASSDVGAGAFLRVVRYSADGVLDTTFGCETPPCTGYGDGPENAIGISGTLQPDAKIVVVGTQIGEFGQNIPIVARFDNTVTVPAAPVVPVPDAEPAPVAPTVPATPLRAAPVFTG